MVDLEKQLGEIFLCETKYDELIEEIVMNPEDYSAFTERMEEGSYDVNDHAEHASGEVVAFLWGATIRLSNSVRRGTLRIITETREFTVELFI